MTFDSQLMYVIGSLLAGLGAIAAFVLGFRAMQRQQDTEWQETLRKQEEWKQQVGIANRQTQNVSG